MNKSRLVWRPNAFTAKEWDQLSQQQQIDWWKRKERETKNLGPASPRNPLTAMQSYLAGAITERELLTQVFESITPGNVNEFLAACPAEILRCLQEEADQLPADGDDQGWRGCTPLYSVCFAPWITAEEIQQIQRSREEAGRNIREGVRVLRSVEKPNSD